MFVLSKIVGLLSDPANVVFLLLAAGWLLLFTRRRRVGRALVGLAVAIMVVGGTLPLDQILIQHLEGRFPAPAQLPERIDGIVVLGGAVDPVISAARGQVAVNGAVERLTALLPLSKRYPEAKLVFSGGSGTVLTQEYKEARYAEDFFREIGLEVDRILLENQSRNTRENAVLSKEIAQPRPGETWLLVTSAVHMPRSIGAFRAVGWSVLPYPVDYQTGGSLTLTGGLRFSFGLGGYNGVLHEWMGLVAYRLAGWSDTLLPSPGN
jgi:uncharacterized SAM-binding protein YcdF (DUF218 family)